MTFARFSKTIPPHAERDEEDYVFPQRIVVDEETFAALSTRIERPRAPNEALRALFKK